MFSWSTLGDWHDLGKHIAAEVCVIAGCEGRAWVNVVNTIAAAYSHQLIFMVKAFHKQAAICKANKLRDAHETMTEVSQHLSGSIRSVLDLPGADMLSSGSPRGSNTSDPSLRSLLTALSSTLKGPDAIQAVKLQHVLTDCIKGIIGWRQTVLTTVDGSGHLLASACPWDLPVRVLVNGRFEADCLDCNDLVELFCCRSADSALLQQDSTISVARYCINVLCCVLCHPVLLHILSCQCTKLPDAGAVGSIPYHFQPASLPFSSPEWFRSVAWHTLILQCSHIIIQLGANTCQALPVV